MLRRWQCRYCIFVFMLVSIVLIRFVECSLTSRLYALVPSICESKKQSKTLHRMGKEKTFKIFYSCVYSYTCSFISCTFCNDISSFVRCSHSVCVCLVSVALWCTVVHLPRIWKHSSSKESFDIRWIYVHSTHIHPHKSMFISHISSFLSSCYIVADRF